MARLVHTSDWHLGVGLGPVDRRSDIEAALDALVELVADTAPDLVLHTGDLFDRALPSPTDLRLAADALARLSAVAPVLVLAGNHDARATFDALDAFCALGGGRVRLLGRVPGPDPLVAIPTASGGRLRVAPVPFVPLGAGAFGEVAAPVVAAPTYAERVAAVWGHLAGALARDRQPDDVDVAAAHLHVAGAALSSEKAVHVGDDAATTTDAVPPVAYAAFGHLHRPQRLPGPAHGAYAGSLVPVDFGEAGEPKGAVVVEAGPGKPARFEHVPLASGRPLISLEASLDGLEAVADAAVGHVPAAIVRVTLTDRDPVDDLAALVRMRLPRGSVVYRIEQPALVERARRARARRSPEGVAAASTAALFAAFARDRGHDSADADALAALWATSEGDPDADLTAGALVRIDAALGAGSDGAALRDGTVATVGAETRR